MRIVSLVPSLTELVLDLGLEKELVGRTKFCIHPHKLVQSIPKIGGTKNANIQAIINLKPDLILANKEENTLQDVEALQISTHVLVTDISNYTEAVNAIKEIGDRTNRQIESQRLIQKIASKFTTLSELIKERKKVCYLIWNDPLMTVGHNTYIHDMLDKCGFVNIFGLQRRYPTVTSKEIRDRSPEYIFLSSEPFPFKDKHIEDFQNQFPNSKVVLVDGEYFSWYGSRMSSAAEYFIELINEIE